MIVQHLPQVRSVSFVIPGRIGGKGRHRSFIRAGKIAACTPAKTASDEGIVRHFAAQAMGRGTLLTGPLRLAVTVSRLFPNSWSMKRREATFWITGKPDCDNIIKLIGDAMNATVYQDDSQIAELSLRRMYGLPECVTVNVTELTL